MKKTIGLFLVLGFLMLSCSDSVECEDIVCTKEFRTVSIRFVDANGNPQIVKDFTVINKRTGEIMTAINDMASQGLYVVASDADLLKLSEKGDNVQITAINSKTNVKVQADFVISGGLCACHINKISGPDTIQL
jgi:hypothetical protein